MVSPHFAASLFMFVCLFPQFVPESRAQGYPIKPVRLVVGTSPGGGGDIIGRIVAAGLAPVLGQQVIVDNRPGAGGNVAPEIVARAAPDGHTMLGVVMADALNVSLYRQLPFDLVRDFAAITQLASGPQVVVVHPSMPVKSIAELVKLAKAKPGSINYASAGTGTSTFLAAEIFKTQAGVDLVHIAYKGGGASLTAVLSAETTVYFGPVASTLPHIQQGRLRALAVTSGRRVSLMPDLPTVAEAGVPGYESTNWYGLMVPAKTPASTIRAIRDATVMVLKQPAVNKRLIDLGYLIIGDQPEEFAAHIKSQVDRLAKLVKQFGLSADIPK